MEIKRLFDFLTDQLEKGGNRPLISAKENVAGVKQWRHYTFTEVQQYANRVSHLLLSLGIQPGDKIALIAANRPEWNFVDIGCQQIGAMAVPMYPTISEKDYEFIFSDAGIKYAFVGDEIIYNKVKPLMGRIASLRGIYSFDKISGADHFHECLPISIDESEIQLRKDAVKDSDLATIIYTSGTTGNPKGVMLTHKNIVSNLLSVREVTPFAEGEKALSFLPLCHSFERVVFFAYLSYGIHIHYAENLETIGENLKEVSPYCFTTVPRLLEKVYEKIMEKGNALTGFKRK
ncbi:MAG: AMP-binding protein, partial [Bacteroidetes bacterium]|nr:AMP-binding protein [Bacteroidota bacterium]